MPKKPDQYKTPLRTRKDISEFIIDQTHQRSYDHAPHPLCFNVKVRGCDLSFDHLLELWRNHEDDPLYTHNEDWLKAARERHEETSEETLWEWGQEDACSHFTGDSDAYTHLFDGTKVDVAYSFEGRSGGWLSINRFEGFKLNDRDYHITSILEDMSFPTLRKLYQLVTMLKHDLRNPGHEIEYQAAFNFFANACSDIPQPDSIQKTLEFADA